MAHWARQITESGEAARNIINNRSPKDVKIAVHGLYDVYYNTEGDDQTTDQWTIRWDIDSGSEVISALNAADRAREAIVAYGEGGWRVMIPEPSVGGEAQPGPRPQWGRRSFESSGDVVNFLNGKLGSDVHIAVHGTYEVFYVEGADEADTAWDKNWPDNGTQVQEALNATAFPHDFKINYGGKQMG